MYQERELDLLRDTLRRHFNVNGFGSNWLDYLKRELYHPKAPGRAAQFKQELAEAILHRTVTPAEYERLTGEDFDTPEELEQSLRQLWRDLYDDEPVTLSDSKVA